MRTKLMKKTVGLWALLLLGCGTTITLTQLTGVVATNWDKTQDSPINSPSIAYENYAIKISFGRSTEDYTSSVGAIRSEKRLANPIQFITVTSFQTFQNQAPYTPLNQFFGIGTTLQNIDSLNKQRTAGYFQPQPIDWYLSLLQKPNRSDRYQFIITVQTTTGTVLKDTTDLIEIR